MTTFVMRDGSGSVTLRWLVEDKDRHGNVRLYLRRPGRAKVRMRERPGTDAFMAEYHAALEGPAAASAKAKVGKQNPVPPNSLDWLLERYYKAAEFTRLDQRTRHVRRLILEKLRPAHGHKPYRLLEARNIAKWRDAKADRPEAANNLVKALRQLFAWAMQPHVNLAASNPAKDVPYLQSDSGGWHSWTIEEIERFEEKWPVGSKARLALSLLLYLGVRRSDVVLLGRQMVKDGWLTFSVSKGRRHNPVTLTLPVLPVLAQVIEASPCGELTFLVNDYGRPFSGAGFGNKMRDWCDAAGLPHCTAHGLRKAGAAIAAEHGASERQLMAIYGWKTMKEAAHYTAAARQKVLAGEAMPMLARKAPAPPAEEAAADEATARRA